MDKLTDENSRVRIPEQLIDTLGKARRQRKLTQIAKEAKVSKQTVSKIARRGQHRAEAARQARIASATASAMRVDFAWLTVDLEMPREWTLPAEFNVVPEGERDQAVEMLRWALNTRARVARSSRPVPDSSDAVSGGDLPGGGDSPTAGR